jgi:hypothetical protein
MPLSAIALNFTLKRSGSALSSTDKMIGLIQGELRKLGVEVRQKLCIRSISTTFPRFLSR